MEVEATSRCHQSNDTCISHLKTPAYMSFHQFSLPEESLPTRPLSDDIILGTRGGIDGGGGVETGWWPGAWRKSSEGSEG